MASSDTNLIANTLEDWTRGLEPEEKPVSVFSHIRDMPYALIPELMTPYTGPEGLLSCKQGSCSPKHFLLGRMFQLLGIPLRYASFSFFWKEQLLLFPKPLKLLAAGLPLDHHLACKAYLQGAWRLVDATWDLPLKVVGAPVNEAWDGESDTDNAVIPRENIIHESAEARVRYVMSREILYSPEERGAMNSFGKKINEWLEGVRVTGKWIE